MTVMFGIFRISVTFDKWTQSASFYIYFSVFNQRGRKQEVIAQIAGPIMTQKSKEIKEAEMSSCKSIVQRNAKWGYIILRFYWHFLFGKEDQSQFAGEDSRRRLISKSSVSAH